MKSHWITELSTINPKKIPSSSHGLGEIRSIAPGHCFCTIAGTATINAGGSKKRMKQDSRPALPQKRDDQSGARRQRDRKRQRRIQRSRQRSPDQSQIRRHRNRRIHRSGIVQLTSPARVAQIRADAQPESRIERRMPTATRCMTNAISPRAIAPQNAAPIESMAHSIHPGKCFPIVAPTATAASVSNERLYRPPTVASARPTTDTASHKTSDRSANPCGNNKSSSRSICAPSLHYRQAELETSSDKPRPACPASYRVGSIPPPVVHRAHHSCHILRKAASISRVKAGPSISDDRSIRCRNVVRSSDKRGTSLASAATMRT